MIDESVRRLDEMEFRFSAGGAASLDGVSPGGSIHVIGVCGVAMGQLAMDLSERGFQVTGSDQRFDEPMGTYLRNSSVVLFHGYAAENLPPSVELVIIGNAMFPDNPEIQEVARRRLPYTSLPQVLGEYLVGHRHAVVVAGTHGKTTVTGMIAHVLREAGREPSWFVGGACDCLPRSCHVGEGDVAVLEGDEYHTAFYARVPKFRFYRGKTVVLNAIEFDHADLYPSVDDVLAEYRWLVESIPADGCLVACVDYPLVCKLLDDTVSTRCCGVVEFGFSARSSYRIEGRTQHGRRQMVSLRKSSGERSSLSLSLMGDYNAVNATAAVAVLDRLGVPSNDVFSALESFQSMHRRQHVWIERGPVILVEDFAHHPTAVGGTIRAMKEAWPRRRLWAIFEPRSNTSRRRVFEEAYLKSFREVDHVVIARVGEGESRMNEGIELIDVDDLVERLVYTGTDGVVLEGAAAIAEHVLARLQPGDLVVVMSNGPFGGLVKLLNESIHARFRS